MNIVMISQEYPPYLVGGTATHVQELIQGFAGHGHSIDLFTYSMERSFSIMDHGARIHFFHFPLPDRKHQYDGGVHEVEQVNGMLAEYVKRVLGNGRAPDVIHAHDWVCFGCANRLRELFGSPVVLTMHMVWGAVVDSIVRHPQRADLIKTEGDCCRRADKVIAVSHSVRNEVVRRYGVDGFRVEVVFNGFDPALFDPAAISGEAVEAERECLALNGKKLIVYAGRLSPQKGLVPLLRSAMYVLQERADVLYAIAGGLERGGHSDVLTDMAARHPRLKDKVIFLNRISRERLAALYRLATLAVVPSLYEPFGYAALEPMAMGKPVIATDTGGLAEIIENGKSGLLVPLVKVNSGYDVDVQKLAQAQLAILDDSLLANRLGKGAQARVYSKFRTSQMIEGTWHTYQSVLSSDVPSSDEAAAA
jgi:glycosyltransferase involved in cell wall biosynthesis